MLCIQGLINDLGDLNEIWRIGTPFSIFFRGTYRQMTHACGVDKTHFYEDSPSMDNLTTAPVMMDQNTEAAEKAKLKQDQMLKLKYENMKTLTDQVDGLSVMTFTFSHLESNLTTPLFCRNMWPMATQDMLSETEERPGTGS
jgi:hypothetical protein